MSAHEPPAPAGTAVSRGLEAADEAFHVVRSGTSRLVQLLADELVPLAPDTVEEIDRTVRRIRSALPALAHWQGDQQVQGEWSFEPPFARVGVRLAELDDLADLENVERLRRSFDLLAPRSLALRKEAAELVVEALLDRMRC
ncbi:MAG: hypothetical protein R2761_17710 [Acidimicrobiales bacterium]